MCRWLVYCGETILLSDLLLNASHSLLKQSLPNRELYTPHTDCSEYFDPIKHHNRNHNTNGDGFGVTWYTHDDEKKSSSAHVYKSILPAWNDKNLVSICTGIKSDLVFAHIRAAAEHSSISRENCHPFAWKNISGFPKLKRKIQQLLSDETFSLIEGTTDSEHAFALFLNFLNPKLDRVEFLPQEIRDALSQTVTTIVSLTQAIAVGPSSLNFAVSDGYSVVCTRFRDSCNEDPPSLYYALGSEFCNCNEKNELEMKVDGNLCTAIISSEPLSLREGDHWKLIPRNHIITTYQVRKRIDAHNVETDLRYHYNRRDDDVELHLELQEIKVNYSDSKNNSLNCTHSCHNLGQTNNHSNTKSEVSHTL